MRVIVCNVAIGGWYRRGLARMIEAFEKHSPGYELQSWLNVLPPGTPKVEKDKINYTGYAAKTYAMEYAMKCGADIALLIDASVYPIRHIEPLIDFIWDQGYYAAPAGFTIGEWTNDEMLAEFSMTRDEALLVPDLASGIVGLKFTGAGRDRSVHVVNQWCAATHRASFAAPHSNSKAADKKHSYRNVGFVSADPRCSGHRQDQSALSLIFHRMGMTHLTPWPRFVAYQAGYSTVEGESGFAAATTVLEIAGL